MKTTMQETFALLKPDIAGTPKEAQILDMIKAHGYKILLKKKIKTPKPSQVATHMEALRHQRPEAYDRNFTFFLNGPLLALRIAKESPDIIKEFRDLVGPTDPSTAPKTTLRGRFGSDTLRRATREGRGLRNAIHASDSLFAARRETALWFHNENITELPSQIVFLEDNNGGDVLEIEFPAIDTLKIKVGQCCVYCMEEQTIPVSTLVGLLVGWKDGRNTSGWSDNSEYGRALAARTTPSIQKRS